jgi:hypothetical protein
MTSSKQETEYIMRLLCSRIETEDNTYIRENIARYLAVLMLDYYQMQVLENTCGEDLDVLANGVSIASKTLHGVPQSLITQSAVVMAVVFGMNLVN